MVYLRITEPGREKVQRVDISTITKNRELLTKYPLIWSQFLAILKKKFFYNIRNPFGSILQLITIPFLYLFLGNQMTSYVANHSELTISMDLYQKVSPLCLMESSENATSNSLIKNYKKLLGPKCKITELQNISSYVFGLDPYQNYAFLRTAVIGVKFEQEIIYAMFNQEAAHSVPISVTTVFNAIIQSDFPHSPQLIFTNRPIPWIKKDFDGSLDVARRIGFIAAPILTIFWLAMFGFLYQDEVKSGCMNLQFTSGLHPILYWCLSMMNDLVVVILVDILIVIMVDYYGLNVSLWHIGILVILVSFSGLPWVYFAAKIFPTTGSYILAMLLIGVVCSVAVILNGRAGIEPAFIFISFYNAALCAEQIYTNNTGSMWINYLCFLASGTLLMSLLVMIDLRTISRIRSKVKDKPMDNIDEDVVEEIKKVETLTKKDIQGRLLVAKHLKKNYGKKVAVRDATFTVEP